jgi:hypothetical protein
MKYLAFLLALWMTASAIGLAQTPKPADKNAAKKAEPVDDPPPVLSVPADYRYDAAGRRDPFANPIPKGGGEPSGSDQTTITIARPPGLPGLLLAEARLSGVVTSREPSMNRAVIVGPGGKTYFATRGDALLDAVIKEIRSDSTVVFTIVSRSNKQPTERETVRSVSTSAGENK